jgi:hypothetical protein
MLETLVYFRMWTGGCTSVFQVMDWWGHYFISGSGLVEALEYFRIWTGCGTSVF